MNRHYVAAIFNVTLKLGFTAENIGKVLISELLTLTTLDFQC